LSDLVNASWRSMREGPSSSLGTCASRSRSIRRWTSWCDSAADRTRQARRAALALEAEARCSGWSSAGLACTRGRPRRLFAPRRGRIRGRLKTSRLGQGRGRTPRYEIHLRASCDFVNITPAPRTIRLSCAREVTLASLGLKGQAMFKTFSFFKAPRTTATSTTRASSWSSGAVGSRRGAT
jgi:hypothetical protein